MGKQWKQCQTLFFCPPKSLQMVIAAMKLKDICSLEEDMPNPDSILKKQRHYLANKGLSSQGYGFSSSQGCESWTIKTAEGQILDAFELWCWRRLLRVPWTARRSNQSTLKEISPKYSLKGLMLKLKFQYFGHLMKRTDSLEKKLWCWERLKAEEGADRGWYGWMASPTRWTWVWVNSRSWWCTERPGMLQSMGSQWVRHD